MEGVVSAVQSSPVMSWFSTLFTCIDYEDPRLGAAHSTSSREISTRLYVLDREVARNAAARRIHYIIL